MTDGTQLHALQLRILKKLLFSDVVSFAKLKPNPEMENSQFSFHLVRLINNGLVQKEACGYRLTDRGKEYANRVDSRDLYIRVQAKLSVVPCCIRTLKGKTQYLIYTRKKHPFWGYQGFPSGKIKYGETVTAAAERELREESGLIGKAECVSVKHYIVREKRTKKVLEDKVMFICVVKSPSCVIKSSREGKFEWVTEENLSTYMTKPYPQFKEFFQVVQNQKREVDLSEKDLVVKEF